MPANGETGYEGYYTITDQLQSAETQLQCSCGVLIWDVDGHVHFHQSLGHLCTVERQA